MCQNITFSQAQGSPINNNSQHRGLISRDVNNDGKLDLLVANAANSSIKVYMGLGNGQFTVAVGSPVAISGGPIYITTADFNGDSFLDLATANYNSGTMAVLLGNGLGSFTNAIGSPYNTSGAPYCIDVADYNLDGKTDLITSSVGSNQVFVFHGSGIGTFTLASGFPMSTPIAPYHVSAGFFNSDIYPDFATANGISNNVSVFLGSSNGVFSNAPGSPFPVGSQPRTIAVKDMNNNGSVDLVVTNLGSSNVHVLLSSPNGSFTNAPGSPKSVGSAPYQSTISDFNLDGSQDVIVTNNGANSISVLLGSNNGSITISPGSGLSIGSEPQPICNGDFNGDGKFDIAIGDWNGLQINVLLNQTPGPCQLVASFSQIAGAPGTYTFSNTSTGTTANSSYLWNFGGQGVGSGTLTSYSFSTSGIYTVSLTVTNYLGCNSMFTQTLNVVICPLVASFSLTAGTAGSYSFTSTSTGTTLNSTYSWSFGGTNTTSGPITNYTFPSNGIYTVTLTVTNNDKECSSTYTTNINVDFSFVGLGNLKSDDFVSIFPNPTTGEVEFNNIVDGEDLGLKIYNVFGMLDFSAELKHNSNKINLGNLSQGLYFYRLVRKNGKLITGQIVIEK